MKRKYDVTTFGEFLIDFTEQGSSGAGQKLFARNPGGAPVNVAVTVKRLGGESAFIGKVGADMHGEFLRSVLEQEKICTDGLISDPDFFTTLAFVSLSDGIPEYSFAREPGADIQITKEDINKALIEQSKIFHTGSLSMTDEPAREATLFALKYAREQGCIISCDPNYRASLWTDEATAVREMKNLIPFADIIKLSEKEAELITGENEPEKASASLLEQGVKIALVTMGEKGAYYASLASSGFAEAVKSHAADTTGAGDVFLGSFLRRVALSEKLPEQLTSAELYDFTAFANTAAALSVRKEGAIPSIPYIKDVNEKFNIK